MNTMEITKVVAGLAGSLLILLLLKLGASSYYIGEEGGDEHAEAAYTIATLDDGSDDEAEAVVPLAELLASADLTKGERVFKKCAACHSVEPGANGTGPSLFGVIDRAQASTDFGGYSSTLTGLGGDWSIEAMNEFILKPRDYAPGTAMTFGGLPKEEDRVNLIAYLQTLQ